MNGSPGYSAQDELREIKQSMQRFFEILDIKEVNNEGNLWSPTYISSCRVMTGVELDKILKRMKELCGM